MLVPFWMRQRIALAAPKDGGAGSTDAADDTGDDLDAADDNDAGDDEPEPQRPSLEDLLKDEDFKAELDQWNEGWFKDRWAREEKKRKREAAKQQQKQLEDEEQFQELVDQQKTEIATLEADLESVNGQIGDLQTTNKTLQQQLEAANSALKVYVDKLKAQIPEALQPALDLIEEKPLVEQLSWLAEHASEDGDGRKQKRQIPPTNDPSDEDRKRKRRDNREPTRRPRRTVSKF